jgi:hypothetical protein
MFAGLGGCTDVDGFMVRILLAKIGHPVRKPPHLRRADGRGVALEVHANHLDGAAGQRG